jgi:hypothetical protein
MAFKVGSSRGNREGGQSTFGSSETIAVRVDSVHSAGKTANHAEDYFVGTLLHNAAGIDVDGSRDPNTWASTTQVKVRQRAPKVIVTGDNAPYAVIDFNEGEAKGNAKPVGKNPIIIIENAWKDSKTGEISGGWMHIGANDSPENVLAENALAGQPSYVHSNVMTQVNEEKMGTDANGQPKAKQSRIVYLPEYAALIAGDGEKTALEVLIEKSAQWLYPNAEMGGGHPSVILRIESLSQPMVQVAWLSPARTDDGQYLDAATSVAKFLDEQEANDEGGWKTDEDGNEVLDANGAKIFVKEGNFKHFISNIDNEADFVIEMIPTWTFNTGAKSTPSAQSASKGRVVEGDDRFFRVPNFKADGSVTIPNKDDVKRDKDGNKLPYGSQLIAPAHMFIRRKFDAREKVWRPWSASKTTLVKQFDSFYHHIYDLPTHVTPPQAVERFMAVAQTRHEHLQAYKNNSKPAAAAAPAAADAQPDDTNGLSENSFSPS